MAGEEAGVMIPEEAAIQMAQRLLETGRIGGMNPQVTADLRMKLAKTVMSQWGVRTPRFSADGGGWLVDLSDVTGDVLFGVIQSDNGVRSLKSFVDEDTARRLLRGGGDQPNQGTLGAPEQPAAPPPPKEPDPDEPRLIVFWEGPLKDAKARREAEAPNVERVTYAEVQDRVLELLMSGAIVEVWSNMKEPKITVSL